VLIKFGRGDLRMFVKILLAGVRKGTEKAGCSFQPYHYSGTRLQAGRERKVK